MATRPVLAILFPLLGGCLLAAGCRQSDSQAHSLPGDALGALLTEKVSKSTQVPGAVLGVMRKGERWTGAAGLADSAKGTAMQPGMRLRVGSLTKQFTAALVLKLAEEGKLSLDDTVDRWLPDLNLPYDSQITIRMLLSHTSGVPEFGTESFWRDNVIGQPTRSWQPSEVVALAMTDSSSQPATVFSYCNTGYVLAGLIAQAASGEDVAAAMRNRFFTPLGMSHTELAVDASFTGDRAHGYLLAPGASERSDTADWNPSYAWTAGSLISTVEDLLTWAEALFGGRVLSTSSLKAMVTPVAPATDYGLGIGLQRIGDGRTFAYHTGEIPGYYAALGHHQESDLSIAVLTNREDILDDSTNDVLTSVFTGAASLLP